METKTTDYTYDNVIQVEDSAASRKFIANVFLWMFVALGISAILSYVFAFNPELSSLLRDNETGSDNIMGTVVMFAPLILVFVIGARFQKASFGGLLLLFIAFSAIMGISLSYIFFRYSLGTISTTFITAAIVFGSMAVGGYITHQDLTKFGSIMIMLLWGIIIATVINILILHSSSLDLIISYVGVAVFVGLTAYDVQKLKQLGATVDANDREGRKLSIMGALTLYLDFVNLFLFLLRIFGGGNRR
ncbi:Bax inhibitor-1/YccA family protein [Mucilaginibacter pallidiroseus]|uniref:Bax inhibitor-1/YccA family protein n=1 Tax=Mucilaginibacter pallidiroseus TaxID=2599295 RepID=A0A563TXG7_9SPHI|nr:Bax inhibitor-1/YccA family protein [Mucilaginibacter pallidiroseus]TWR24045.1 Bax inhibitor-1/YccA family protein [Mucilaginibacter pallidiroseus]